MQPQVFSGLNQIRIALAVCTGMCMWILDSEEALILNNQHSILSCCLQSRAKSQLAGRMRQLRHRLKTQLTLTNTEPLEHPTQIHSTNLYFPMLCNTNTFSGSVVGEPLLRC